MLFINSAEKSDVAEKLISKKEAVGRSSGFQKAKKVDSERAVVRNMSLKTIKKSTKKTCSRAKSIFRFEPSRMH